MKEQVEAVQRMQDYIQEHLKETVTLADLSRVSLFSPWHSDSGRLYQAAAPLRIRTETERRAVQNRRRRV